MNVYWIAVIQKRGTNLTEKQFMRAAAVATVAAVGLSTVAVPISENPVQAADIKLKDVAGHPDEAAILALIEKGMINGYPDGTFQPDRQLTRYDITLIIGRYLVQLGYHLPSDAKTKIRFNDLTRKSEEALLNYSALLHDVGILLGDTQKRLNPYEKLTREQLALILTRAFTIIDDFNYVSHVEKQRFVREFEDTLALNEESQEAIDVLDYYDIVVDNNYFPKEFATRGQFATMTYKMMHVKEQTTGNKALAIESWKVISAKRVKFTMSDGSTHDIILEKPLVENVPTPIQVTIKGRSFSTTVTYRVAQLKVVNVENINAGQFVVHFNQEVDLVDSYLDQNSYYWQNGYWYQQQQNVSKFFKLTDRYGRTIALQKGELSEDRKSFKITIAERNALLGTYNLQINGVHAVDGLALPKFEDSYYFEADFYRPEIIGTEQLSTDVVKVKFSEPVYSSNNSFTFKIGSETVTGVQVSYLDATWGNYTNATEVIFDLTNARYRYGKLPTNATIDVTTYGLRDLANNYLASTSSNSYTFKIKKGGTDNVPPRLVSIQQLGAKQFKLTFNEPMSRIYAYQLQLESPLLDYKIEAVTPAEGDNKSVVVTVDEFLEDNITIRTNSYYGVYDETGTKGEFSKTYKFTYDTSPAKIVNTRVVRENNLEYLFIEFDRNVNILKEASAILDGYSMYRNDKVYLYEPEKAKVFPVKDNPKMVKVPLHELVFTYDRDGAKFYTNLQFENVVTEYSEVVLPSSITFTRTKDYNFNAERLEIVSVDTSRTDRSITDNKLVVITFNMPVHESLATDTYNYNLGRLQIDKVELNRANPNQVLLKIKNDISNYYNPKNPYEEYLYVWNLQSKDSVHAMTPYYEPVYFTESTPPTVQSMNVINTRQIQITFNEALSTIASDTFSVTDSSGNRLATTATNDPSNSSKILLTLEKDLIPRQTITISQQLNRKIQDAYLNEMNFAKTNIVVPTSMPSY